MHSAGKCVFSVVKEVDIENILFDTGALGANYVSREFIEKNKYNNNIVELKPAKVKIQLANKNNIIQVENQVSLTLKFTSDNTNKTHIYTGDFLVIDMENDFIMGLPAIIGELYDYFKDMLSKARILADKMIHIENQQSISRVISVNLNSVVILEPGQMLEPWQYPVIAPAPEETLTVEPVNFSYALHYLEIGHEEAVN
jgi:hypothetical protein